MPDRPNRTGGVPRPTTSGLGGALLARTVARADAQSVPAYLVTMKRDNLAYYARFGFEVRQQLRVGRPLPQPPPLAAQTSPAAVDPPLHTVERRWPKAGGEAPQHSPLRNLRNLRFPSPQPSAQSAQSLFPLASSAVLCVICEICGSARPQPSAQSAQSLFRPA